MKSKYSNVLTLAVAVVAFVPMLAVDSLLDGYVRTDVRDSLQHSADAIATRIHQRVAGASAALDAVIDSSPSLCTPTFIANVHRAMAASLNVKQILVENTDRVQYCDALGRDVIYSPMSEELTIPGDSETLQVVTYADMTMPALKVNHRFGDSRTVAAFVPLLGERGQSLLDAHRASLVRVSLTNGTPVLTTGNAQDFDARTSSFDFVSAQSVAEQLPLRVEVAVPFELARARYGDLDVAFTLTAGLMSALFLLMALQYTRSSKIPSFDLERAISRNEIKPFYQPVINLRTGALEGCEVLCRWEKPNGKIVGPNAFIEYAELTGLALPMTLSLMEQVKHDLGSLAAEMPDIKISINLFDGHFQDGAIVEDVQAIFGGSQIGYHQLVFEITERRPLGDSPQTFAVISGLHALGAKLALDDTGTGHSNLAYLATLGVDVIKIDRIFVDMIKPGVTQVPVLDGLIAMAKDLDTDIVAEGVETEEQAVYLRARGVYQAQGFLFAPALRPAAFRELALALNAVSHSRGETEVADAA